MRHVLIVVALTQMSGAGVLAEERLFTELDFQFGKTWIRDDALGNPTGYTFSLIQRLTARTKLSISYAHGRGSDLRYGYFYSSHYFAAEDQLPVWETVEQSYRANLYQCCLVRDLSASDYRILQTGGGICLLRTAETEHGLTTGESRVSRYENRFGFVLDIAVEDNFNLSNFVLRLSFTHRFFIGQHDLEPTSVGGYSTTALPDDFTTTELRIGIGYRLYWGESPGARENAEGGI